MSSVVGSWQLSQPQPSDFLQGKKRKKNAEERKADRPLAFSVAAGKHSQEACVDPHLLLGGQDYA